MRATVPVDVAAVEERLGGVWTSSHFALAGMAVAEALMTWNTIPPNFRSAALALMFAASVWAVKGRPFGLSVPRFIVAICTYWAGPRIWVFAEGKEKSK